MASKVATAAESSKLRLFSLGVGGDPGAELLQGMASLGCGSTEMVGTSSSELVEAAQRLIRDAVSVSYLSRELTVEFLGLPPGIEMVQWPKASSRITVPRRRTDFYFRGGALSASDLSRMRLRVSGGSLAEPVEVPVVVTASGRTLSKLCAHSQILSLERRNIGGQYDAVILDLALAEGLASSQTSFVAVEHQNPDAKVVESKLHDDERLANASADLASEMSNLECESRMLEEECPRSRSRDSRRVSISRSSYKCAAPPTYGSGDALPDFGDDAVMETLEFCSATVAVNKKRKSRPALAALPRSRLVSSFAAVATSAAKSISDKVEGLSRGLEARRKRKAPTAPKVLPPAAVLPLVHGACRYQGTLTHHLFGPDPVQLTLAILRETSPGEYEGEWAAMGQVEKVRISLKESHEEMGFGPRLIITNTSGDECTVLQGEVFRSVVLYMGPSVSAKKVLLESFV